MDGVEGYSHEAFIQECRAFPQLVPIAGYHPIRDAAPDALRKLRDMGFCGIKIHPRFSGLTNSLETLAPTLQYAGEVGLIVFLCTYLHCGLTAYPKADPLHSIVNLLRETPQTRVVLVHGGDVNLLRFAEVVRFNNNLLLDLSMSMMKYEGSSIDQDIDFLFRRFDRRICIGTDWPEYSHQEVRERFEHFARDLPQPKRFNIAYRNLVGFLGIEQRFQSSVWWAGECEGSK